MKPRRRTTWLAAAAASVILPLTACGSTGTSSSGSSATDITVAQVTEPESVTDPLVDGSLAGYSYYYNLFDSLARLDPNGKVVPWLATSWKATADQKTWTFKLRSGVKFTDGEPLTANDVAFTFNTIMKTPDSDPRTYLAPLDSAEATNASTVVFHLNEPFSAFPSLVTAAAIVPAKVYKKLGSQGFAKAPVGSGPYTFVSRTVGVNFIMKRNPNYWGTKAPFEKVTFQTVADEDARLNGVVSGSLNEALIAPNQVDSLSGNSSVEVKSVQSNGVTFLGMNSKVAPLNNEKVRQAIQYAIDKNSLVKDVLAGRGEVAHEMIAPNVGGYDPSVPVSTYDPTKAKQLLAEAGYKGQPIVLEYASNGRIPLSQEVVQAVQGMLDKVGIKVTLKGMDQSTLSDRIYGTQSMKGIYLNTYAPSQMDGDPVIEDLFAGLSNDYMKSPVTKAMVQQTRKVGGSARVAAYGKLMNYNLQHVQLIPLYVPETDFLQSPGLDWQPRSDGLSYFGAPIK